MKIQLLFILLLAMTTACFAQSKREAMAAEYAAEAQQKFQLDEATTAKVQALWLARNEALKQVSTKSESGAMSEAEANDTRKEINLVFRNKMCEFLGVVPKEYRNFHSSVMSRLRS